MAGGNTDTAARRLASLVACLLDNGNTPYSIGDAGLARIGHYQGFTLAELSHEFAKQQTERSLSPCNLEEMDK